MIGSTQSDELDLVISLSIGKISQYYAVNIMRSQYYADSVLTGDISVVSVPFSVSS